MDTKTIIVTLVCAVLGSSALTALILRGTSAVVKLGGALGGGSAHYIYVPSALVDSYKADANWSGYADHIRAIEDYPDITGG